MVDISISVNIQGIDALQAALDRKVEGAQQAQKLSVQRVAYLLRDTMIRYAKEGHPDHPEVQTGRLSNSIFADVRPSNAGTSASVGTDLDYAVYVEYGHQQEPGRFVPALGRRLVASEVQAYPFFRPAIVEVIDGGLAQRIVFNTVQEMMK